MTEQPADLNQRFRAAVDHFPSSFAIYDRERRFEFVNAAVLRATGLEERQFLGRRDDEVFPADLTSGYLPALNRAFDETRAQTIELSLPPRLGAREYVITYLPQLDPGGNVERVYGLSEEVTERKRAERLTAGLNCVLELLATGGSQSAVLTALVKMVQEQCRGVVASVLVLDETGRRLRHGAAPDLPAALVREADGLEIGPAAGSCGTAAFRGARVISQDLSVDPLWANCRAVAARYDLKACWSQPIFSRDGQVLGTFALYPDAARGPDESEIHLLESAAHVAGVAIEHDRAQAALRRAKEEAEAANLAKDDFLATVSHELRTPIGAVLLWAKLLRSGNLDPEGQRQALDTIVRAAEDQKRLVNTLLDASRILHGRVQAELRPLALAKLVREAVAAMRPSAQAKGVELKEVLCEAPALGDPPLLRQVVTNLVDNALKFTPPGGRVQVRLTRRDDAAHIEVADTGAGMSADFLPHAFDRFRQGDASIDRAHGGLGLGAVDRARAGRTSRGHSPRVQRRAGTGFDVYSDAPFGWGQGEASGGSLNRVRGDRQRAALRSRSRKRRIGDAGGSCPCLPSRCDFGWHGHVLMPVFARAEDTGMSTCPCHPRHAPAFRCFDPDFLARYSVSHAPAFPRARVLEEWQSGRMRRS